MNRLKINIDKIKVMLIGSKDQLKSQNVEDFILSYDDTPFAAVTLGVRGLRELPRPQSRRAGWPSMASFNILVLFVQASHVIHLVAATNIRNILPSFPYPSPPHSPLFYFFRLPSTILTF